MKRLLGLQARFLAIVAISVVLVVAALGVLLLRQNATQGEILAQSGNEIHQMVSGSLRNRGESAVTQAADSLVNPVYYFDLDAIGRTARTLLQQPNVRYVIVYDGDGNVLHDGSADIPTFTLGMISPGAEMLSTRSCSAAFSSRTLVPLVSPSIEGIHLVTSGPAMTTTAASTKISATSTPRRTRTGSTPD